MVTRKVNLTGWKLNVRRLLTIVMRTVTDSWTLMKSGNGFYQQVHNCILKIPMYLFHTIFAKIDDLFQIMTIQKPRPNILFTNPTPMATPNSPKKKYWQTTICLLDLKPQTLVRPWQDMMNFRLNELSQIDRSVLHQSQMLYTFFSQ